LQTLNFLKHYIFDLKKKNPSQPPPPKSPQNTNLLFMGVIHKKNTGN
jgi:hypothetical protein